MLTETSAGTLVFVGDCLLLCHVTNSDRWDIPKGLIDKDESAVDAAVRELREETGIVIQPRDLTHINRFNLFCTRGYRKDLELFELHLDILDIDTCRCTSYFNDERRNYRRTLEVDDFRLFDKQRASMYVAKGLHRVLEVVL